MSAPNRASVHVEGVEHAYGDVEVLRRVSLDVEPGESIALLGPSGCGKTTLLRCIAGLERPTGGTIKIGDDVVAAGATWIAPERRRVGLVFQDWALFPHMNVRRNVAYGLERGSEQRSRTDEAIEMVGLGGLEERMPSELSGGQQQRVALARALAPRPRVLLLDEPFSNLDTATRADIRAEVQRLLLGLGITAIYVTHDQEEAFVLGQRVAVMRDGSIRQFDTPAALYAEPATRWIGEFVGTANVLRGEAEAGLARCALGIVPVDPEMSGDVDLLFRPEQLALADGDAATVELVEFYGHDAMVVVALGDDMVRIRTTSEVRRNRGDRVDLTFTGHTANAFPT